MPGPPYIQTNGQTFTLNLTAGDAPLAIIGGGPGAKWACTIIIRASVNNSSTPCLWGFNSAQQELAPGEGVAVDIPMGALIDLQSLHFSGNGSTGQVVFVSAVLIP